MRICLLASGSRGNALYLESDESRILIDAGLPARELTRRLEGIGVGADELDALFVTHEHGDHCLGVGPLSRRFSLPVYLHHATRAALPNLGRIDDLREITEGEAIDCKGLRITPFPVTHDAVAPVGFLIETAAGKVGVATDLGIATRLVRERLKGCRALVIEANHDPLLLRDGPYPWPLKQRIRGHHGHLSNDDCADLLGEVVSDRLEVVFLAHLSLENNRPELAQATIAHVLATQNLCAPQVVIGRQDEATACLELSA
ncbi:MBL fold metallo-hydrolase [Trichloromonas sp.]|uniref:MBL fold metallo-hydrolase n=1 Tax=Trichloromonas sp. TaxID=3069249 RepID=UPI002A4AD531|nr:MBL fold metallo-hydrolase [Trichloromonas sp.]